MEKLELDIDDMFGPAPPRKPVPAPAPIVAKPPAAPPATANPRPAAVKRAPPPIPARPSPSAPTPPAAAALSDQRVRELHQRLVDAQRQLANARPVSVEGLAKSLREAETKIRAQHGNRKIDFDIVVKDGKAVVKPILR
jgi:hypothetical protein